jgi:glycosyltransferase involved in cell wall biosynthesis
MPGKPKILFIAVLPPPFHGVPIANSILLSSEFIQRKYELILVPIKRNILQSGGNFSWRTVLDDLTLMGRTVSSLVTKRPKLTYFCIAQSRLGLWRDAGLIGLARLLGSKCLVQLRGGNFRNVFQDELTPGEQRLIKVALNFLDGVIVLDQSLTWIFQGLVPSDHIFVLSNGVPETYTNDAKISAAKVRRQDSSIIKVTFLSNLLKGKGFETLLETAALLAQRGQNQDFVFTLAGAAPDSETARQVQGFVDSHDLTASVSITGEILGPEKWELLLNSDVFVFPSYYRPEGQPWAIIEALAAGLPVISTAQGAIPAMVKEGINGFIVPARNPAAIAARLRLLQRDPDLRLAMGQASRDLYLSHFTGEKFVKGFAAIIDRVLEQS